MEKKCYRNNTKMQTFWLQKELQHKHLQYCTVMISCGVVLFDGHCSFTLSVQSSLRPVESFRGDTVEVRGGSCTASPAVSSEVVF